MNANSAAWSTMIVLGLIGIGIYLVATIRRARREHRARSEERAAQLMIALQRQSAQATAQSAPATAPAPTTEPPLRPRHGTRTTTTLTKRARFLTDTQRLLYLVLRAAMPDHTIMANIRIVDLLDGAHDAAAIERDPRLGELLRERADFIVCGAELVPIAALVVYEAGIATVPDETKKVGALREMGIKFLRFRADSLPRPAEIRGIILG